MDAVNVSIQTLWCGSATASNIVNDTMILIDVSAVNVCLAHTSYVQVNNDNCYIGYCPKSLLY